MTQYFIARCVLAKEEITLFLDPEWARKRSCSLLDVCVCLEGRIGRCGYADCRFHKDAPNTVTSPFSHDDIEDLLSGQKPTGKPKHRAPERIRHVFEALGIEPKATPERAQLLKDGSGFVYVIRCRDLVKVGIAEDIDKRMAILQIGNPDTLELIKSFPSLDPLKDEQQLHDLLEKYRVRGEWFSLPPEVIEKITRVESIEEYAAKRVAGSD